MVGAKPAAAAAAPAVCKNSRRVAGRPSLFFRAGIDHSLAMAWRVAEEPAI